MTDGQQQSVELNIVISKHPVDLRLFYVTSLSSLCSMLPSL